MTAIQGLTNLDINVVAGIVLAGTAIWIAWECHSSTVDGPVAGLGSDDLVTMLD